MGHSLNPLRVASQKLQIKKCVPALFRQLFWSSGNYKFKYLSTEELTQTTMTIRIRVKRDVRHRKDRRN